MQRRESLVRVDDTAKRDKVDAVRALIYDKNCAIDNEGVEELLKDQLLTPTAVSATITGPFGFS